MIIYCGQLMVHMPYVDNFPIGNRMKKDSAPGLINCFIDRTIILHSGFFVKWKLNMPLKYLYQNIIMTTWKILITGALFNMTNCGIK